MVYGIPSTHDGIPRTPGIHGTSGIPGKQNVIKMLQ